MTTTITIQDLNLSINGFPIEDLLLKFYHQGRNDASENISNDVVTFQDLVKELRDQGRIIGLGSLIKKAEVKTFRFDVNKLALLRKDIKLFIS